MYDNAYSFGVDIGCRSQHTTPVSSYLSGQHHQTDPSMQVASEVKDFSGASERLLSTIAMNRQLTEEEAKVIQYYCKELLAKVAPRLHHPE